jgi:hypothetical protein
MFSSSNLGLCLIGELLDGELKGLIDAGSMILFRLVCEIPASRHFDGLRYRTCRAGDWPLCNLPNGLLDLFFTGELDIDVRF